MYKLAGALLFWCGVCSGAKILAIFNHHKSHCILGDTLLRALAERGHHVTMMSPYPLLRNYEEIELKSAAKYREEHLTKVFQGSEPSLLTYFRLISRMIEVNLEEESVQTLLKSDKKFDLVIQFWALNEAFLGIAHHFNASVIAFVPVGGLPWVDYISGNTSPYSYVPNIFTTLTDEMSFLERFENAYEQVKLSLAFWYDLMPYQQEVLRKYFPSAPPLQDLIDKVDLVLVNSHYSTESPRPYVPNVLQIGGFHIQENLKMGDDVKAFLDGAQDGAVYFSFGSNVKTSTLGEKKLSAFIEAFRKTKLRVLWKFEGELPNRPENVKVADWLPQMGVLAHPNLKIFITHGGYGSLHEGLHFGVPLICIPFYADQLKNCFDAAHRGFAIQMKPSELTEESLSDAIQTLLTNMTYREHAQFRSDLYRNQPIKPLDHAIFWIEHVLKHKSAKHLKPYGAKLVWYKYFMLDVLAFLLLLLIIILLILYVLIKKVIVAVKKKHVKLE